MNSIELALRDAVEEVNNLNSILGWKYLSDKRWALLGTEDDSLLGWVSAVIDVSTNLVKFSFIPNDRTYCNTKCVAPVEIDSANLTDPEELIKLREMDAAITIAFGLG